MQLSSLVVQMRTGKIGLRKILYGRGIPGVEDKECGLCGQGEPNSVNVLKVSSGKKEHTERRREGICMEQQNPKVNADIAQTRPQSSDLYEEYRPTGIVHSRPEKEKKKTKPEPLRGSPLIE